MSVTTTQTVLAINCDVTCGKRRLHYYYEGYQCTLQLQIYQKGGKGCVVVVYRTPATVNIIILRGHDKYS